MDEKLIIEELRAIRRELDELRGKVAQIAVRQEAAGHATDTPPEVAYVIAAAVAAYLGKRARITRVKVLEPQYDGWRVALQGSHGVRS
jgi:hypothetical protein